MKTLGLVAITAALAACLALPNSHPKHHHHKHPAACTQVAPGWCLGGPPIITQGL